jgi:hypothetical protein
VAGDAEMQATLRDAATAFYAKDRACPIAYEPSGHDFLSPCLAEADFMRRVLAPEAFATWLRGALPGIPDDGSTWLSPVAPSDRSDGKLAHLDGLNLSRAWMLDGIASGLPEGDRRRAAGVAIVRARARRCGAAGRDRGALCRWSLARQLRDLLDDAQRHRARNKIGGVATLA